MVAVQLNLDTQKPRFYVLQEIQPQTSSSADLRLTAHSHVWRPPTDVYETPDAIIVRVEIAGMDESQFTILLDGSHLVIRGSRQEQPGRRAYHQMEIRFGEFISEVDLSQPVDASQVEATYGNGFLHIALPKVRPHKVAID